MTCHPFWSCYLVSFVSWSFTNLKAEWKSVTSVSTQIKAGCCLGRCSTYRHIQKPTFLLSFHRQLMTELALGRRLEASWWQWGKAARCTEGANIGQSPSSTCPESPGISKSEKDMEAVKALEFGVIWKINILLLIQVMAKLLLNWGYWLFAETMLRCDFFCKRTLSQISIFR